MTFPIMKLNGCHNISPMVYVTLLSLLCHFGQARFLRVPDAASALVVPDPDLTLDLSAGLIFNALQLDGGPVNLEDYCAMKEGKFVRRQKVKAVPHSGGDPKPGVVVKANSDDTVDILFKDGDHDMNIPASQVKPRDIPEAAGKDDSACIVEGKMSKVQKKIDNAYDEIKNWLKNRKKKGHKEAAEEDKEQREQQKKAEAAAKRQHAKMKTEEAAAKKKLEATKKKKAKAEQESKQAASDAEKEAAKKKLEEAEEEEEEHEQEVEAAQDEEKEAEQDADEDAGADVADAGDVEDKIESIDKTIKDLEDERASLEKDGKLDPDLRASTDEMIDEAKQAKAALQKVEKAEEKGGTEMVAEVESAEKELKDVKADMKEAERGIYPSGNKWWRYRYEFSYVEALFGVLMSLLAVLGETALHFFRKMLNAQAKRVRWQDERSVPTMYMTWFRYLGSEGMVLLFMNLMVWVLWTTIPWVYESWATIAKDPSMHLPVKPERYKLQAWETAIHLSLAMVMYFLAVYMVVYHASNRLVRWQEWSEHRDSAATSSPRVHSRLSVSVIGSIQQMNALRALFLSEVRMRPDLLEYTRRRRVVLDDDFPFFLYLSHCTHQYLQDIFVVKIWTWVAIVVIFCCFAICHRFFHLGTAELLCIFGAAMIVMFGIMTYRVLKAIEEISKERQRVTDTFRDSEDSLLKQDKQTEVSMGFMMQIVIFFLCFGAVRLIFSYWMWRIYPVYSLICMVGLILFIVVWFFVLAPLVSAFLAVLCCPPYIHVKSFEKTVKIMRPPEMMPGSARDEIHDSVEKIEELVEKLDK